MDTFTHNGLTFRVEHEHDADIGPPWDNSDGHGPVSDWRPNSEDECEGERILSQDRGSARFYDWQEAMRQYRRGRWRT